LQNGDTVEIITQQNSRPSLDWLNFVVTSSARSKIRQWDKQEKREEHVVRGREILEKEFGQQGIKTFLNSEPMQAVAKQLNYISVDDLLAALGHGEATLNQVVNRLRSLSKHHLHSRSNRKHSHPISSANQSTSYSSKVSISGFEGILHHFARCCNPLPGELIIGVVLRMGGISIHRQGCPNVDNVANERLVPVNWKLTDDKKLHQTYSAEIQIECLDRVGVLKDILYCLSGSNINVRNATVKTSMGKPVLISLAIDIRDFQQLDYAMNQIKKMSDILNIHRVGDVTNSGTKT
jgi:GTP pyrophosphokinase